MGTVYDPGYSRNDDGGGGGGGDLVGGVIFIIFCGWLCMSFTSQQDQDTEDQSQREVQQEAPQHQNVQVVP